jgi:hypothetical protein
VDAVVGVEFKIRRPDHLNIVIKRLQRFYRSFLFGKDVIMFEKSLTVVRGVFALPAQLERVRNEVDYLQRMFLR